MQMMVQSQLWIVQNGCQVQSWIYFIRNLCILFISEIPPSLIIYVKESLNIWYLLKKRSVNVFFFFFKVTIISFIIDHVIYWVMWYSGHVMWCKHMIRVWFFSVMVHVLGYIMAIVMNVLYFCISKVCRLFFLFVRLSVCCYIFYFYSFYTFNTLSFIFS